MKNLVKWSIRLQGLQKFLSLSLSALLLGLAFSGSSEVAGLESSVVPGACGLFLLALAAFHAYVQQGLQEAKPWARTITLCFAIVSLPSLMLTLFAVMALIELFRPNVREAFSRSELNETNASKSPACPRCRTPLLIEKRVGPTQMCECGWFARVSELPFLTGAGGGAIRDRRSIVASNAPAIVFFTALLAGWTMLAAKMLPTWVENRPYATSTAPGAAAEREITQKEIRHYRVDPKHPNTITQWRKIGARCNTDGNYRCSRVAYSQILKREPRNTIAMANLGMAESRLGNHEAAISLLAAVIDSGNATYDVLAFYGMSLEQLGETDKALKAYLDVLEIDDRLVDIAQKAVALMIQKGDFRDADKFLDSYTKKHPEAKQFLKPQIMKVEEGLSSKKSSRAMDASASSGTKRI